MIRMLLVSLAAMSALTHPAAAQTAAPTAPAATSGTQDMSPALRARLDGLAAILNGEGEFDAYFAQGFRDQVPEAKFRPLGEQLRAAMGKATGVEQVRPQGPHAAEIVIGFERGIARARIVVDPQPPHAVVGLLLTGTELREDSLAKLDAEFRALPGSSGFGIYRLGNAAPVAVHEWNGSRAAPLGSGFKLYVLAEATRAVAAGERRWSDVVTLGERSLPSGVTQGWPAGAPVTLHTLAVQMISISDNTATDALMRALGRDKVDAIVAASGTANPDATLPMLTTIEAFRLKHPSNAALVAGWAKMTPDARRALLRDQAGRLAKTPLDAGMFGDKPLALQIEWFGSPADMARLLDTIRKSGDEPGLTILGVNPGGDASRFAYQGFKGGSEPGVIAANYLVRTSAGEWMAITGNWHRDDATVDQNVFFGLMNRALTLAAK